MFHFVINILQKPKQNKTKSKNYHQSFQKQFRKYKSKPNIIPNVAMPINTKKNKPKIWLLWKTTVLQNNYSNDWNHEDLSREAIEREERGEAKGMLLMSVSFYVVTTPENKMINFSFIFRHQSVTNKTIWIAGPPLPHTRICRAYLSDFSHLTNQWAAVHILLYSFLSYISLNFYFFILRSFLGHGLLLLTNSY